MRIVNQTSTRFTTGKRPCVFYAFVCVLVATVFTSLRGSIGVNERGTIVSETMYAFISFLFNCFLQLLINYMNVCYILFCWYVPCNLCDK